MKKIVSFLLVVAFFVQIALPVVALENTEIVFISIDSDIEYDNIEDILVHPEYENTHGYLDNTDVTEYKRNAEESLSFDIEGYLITYYKGEDYVVVDEEAGLSLITFEDGGAYINGVFHEIQEEIGHTPEITPFSYGTLFRSHTHTIDVAGLGAGIVAGLVVGMCTTNLVTSAVAGAVAGTFASAKIPDELHPVVQYKHADYTKVVDAFLGIVDWTYCSDLYYGTASNPTRNFVDSWVTKARRQS